jgi:exoribonuclease R
MLPDKPSTDLTSLHLNENRLSIVVEMVIGADGSVQDSHIYRARVRNDARLAYNSVAAWLGEGGSVPYGISAADGQVENLRHVHGALSLETVEARPIFDGDQIRDLQVEEKDRLRVQLISVDVERGYIDFRQAGPRR